MDLFEFDLRYRAYHGLKTRLILDRDQETLINLVKISQRGVPDKKIQELTPAELKWITIETYTEYKTQFVTLHSDTKIGDSSLQTYIERLEYELKVIKEMWFISYFLIVADFVNRAKDNGIVVWPWRWSWAWSLLARCIKITDIDPLPYGLLFERFLNPARISMPDFDIDFEDTQRDKVIEYVREKYGDDKVSAIGTYMQMASKAAFKDSARVLWIPFDRANIFSAIMPDKVSLDDAIKDEKNHADLINIYNSDEKIKEAVELSVRLEWNMRQLWVHACGIIISPKEVSQYTPIQYAPNDHNTIVTQYDWPTLEYIWLLKMDFLWLRNLSVIKNCIKIIKKRAEIDGEELPLIFQQFFVDSSFQPPLDDPYTFEKVFQAGDTTGIFQFEWSWMRRFLVQLKSDTINDLVAMNALYRPGPMEFIPNYIKRKHWEEVVSYMTDELEQLLTQKYSKEVANEERAKIEKDLKPILDSTYGIAVYQEQLMFLVQSMAGFSLAEADLLRRWVGKKKKDIIEQLKKEFMERWEQYKQYKPETTKRVYEKMIEPAASYSFNKSHSVCYAVIAYQTAYLKAHYPVPFYAALIRSVEEDTDTMSTFIAETQQHGIQVKVPDINISFNHVAAIEDHVRLWFISIKGIWQEIGEQIQEERKKWWPFTSLENFLERCEHCTNKKSIEWLIKSWALDRFEDRRTLRNNIANLLERGKKTQSASMGLFWAETIGAKLDLKRDGTISHMEKLMMEQDAFKTFVSWHPLDWLYLYLKKYSFISAIQQETYEWPFTIVWYIKNIQRARKKWFFVRVEDISDAFEFFLKDVVDLQKYDIVYVSWSKSNGRISIEKITRTSRDILKDEAEKAGKYDETQTAIYVKTLRMAEKPTSVEEPIETSWQEEDTSSIFDDETDHHEQESKETQTNDFSLPDSLSTITKMADVIKQNPGNITIKVGNLEYNVNEKWREDIQDLLW